MVKQRAEGAAAKPRRTRAKKADAPAAVPVVEGKPVELVGDESGSGETHPKPRHPDPVPGNDGDALARIDKSFRARFPEQWENMRLCPLQHGIEIMADILRTDG